MTAIRILGLKHHRVPTNPDILSRICVSLSHDMCGVSEEGKAPEELREALVTYTVGIIA